jgi:hypothetical protein
MWMLLKTKRRVIKRVGKRVSRGEWLKGWEKKRKKNFILWGFTFTMKKLSLAISLFSSLINQFLYYQSDVYTNLFFHFFHFFSFFLDL